MLKPKHFRILLVQGGGTDWDRDGRLSGAADLPLSVDERARLEGLSPQQWAPEGRDRPGRVDLLVCGPDEASQATASLASAAYGGVKVRKLDGLRDLDLGLWEGVLPEDLQDRCPTSYRQWVDDPGSVTAPEGEALGAALDRVLGEIRKAGDRIKHEEPVIAVVLRPITHAAVRCWVESLPTSQMRAMAGEGPVRAYEVDRGRFEGVGAVSRE